MCRRMMDRPEQPAAMTACSDLGKENTNTAAVKVVNNKVQGKDLHQASTRGLSAQAEVHRRDESKGAAERMHVVISMQTSAKSPEMPGMCAVSLAGLAGFLKRSP